MSPINRILVIAEHDNSSLNPSTLAVLSCAKVITQLTENIQNTPDTNPTITVLVAGHGCKNVATELSLYEEVFEVLLADAPCFDHFLAENLAPLCVSVAEGFTHILAPATTFGKDLLPRVAALLSVGQISDIVQVVNNKTYIRPMYAGNVMATVQSNDSIQCLTVRTTAFLPLPKISPKSETLTSEAPSSQKKAPIKLLSEICHSKNSEFVELTQTPATRPELSTAKYIVSGGRGFQSKENFKLLEQLADVLGAAIGASRAAVDAGFVPNDLQIGQTGKVVAPSLYIAIGISGAIQHLAGIKDSKVIVAINKDEDAPIFQVADYRLVGDLFQILPELNQELSIRMQKALVK